MAHFFISNYKITQKTFHNNHYFQEKNYFLKISVNKTDFSVLVS